MKNAAFLLLLALGLVSCVSTSAPPSAGRKHRAHPTDKAFMVGFPSGGSEHIVLRGEAVPRVPEDMIEGLKSLHIMAHECREDAKTYKSELARVGQEAAASQVRRLQSHDDVSSDRYDEVSSKFDRRMSSGQMIISDSMARKLNDKTSQLEGIAKEAEQNRGRLIALLRSKGVEVIRVVGDREYSLE